MMKTLIILVSYVITLTSFVESKSTGHEVNKCIEDYLNFQGMFGEVVGESPNPLCLALVEVTKAHILENFKQSFEKEQKESDIQCIMTTLQNTGFMNDALLLAFHGHVQLREHKNEKLIPDTQKRVSHDVYKTFISCDGTRKFGEEFEQMFSASSEEETLKEDEDFCVRHHIIKEGLIKVEGVQLAENPLKLDGASIDCHKVYKSVLTQAEDELVKAIFEEESKEVEGDQLSKSQTECIITVIRDDNFIDKMIPFDYVKEFTLNAEQRQQMKDEFIHTMKQLALKTEKCFI